MSSLKKIKKASKYADCKNSGKGSLLKYYGVKTERRGFRRVALEAGEKKNVTLTVANRAMAVVDQAGERHVDSRNFKIFAGISQPDERSQELTGKKSAEIDVTLG